MRRLLPICCLALALSVGGCGSGASSGGADPADLVPADSSFYVEAVVRPDGEAGEHARALAGKLLRTDDPKAKIRELVDEAARESGETEVTFDDDIDPWLGDKVAVAVSDLQAAEPRFVAVLAAKDEDKASELLAREAEREKARKASSGDVDYWVQPDGEAAGVFEGAAVIASDEKSLQRAIAAADGAHLSEAETYKKAVEDLPDERIGTFFVDAKRLFDAAKAQAGSDPAAGALLGQFGDVQPAAGALLAEEDTIAIETLSGLPKQFSALLGSGGGETPLVGELPGDAWAAGGVPDLGTTAKSLVDQLGGALGGAVIRGQLEQELGLNLDQDVFSWIGDAAFFARGDDMASLTGGAVIEVTDEERAAEAVPKLIGLARQQGDAPFEPVRVPGATMAFAAVPPGAAQPIVVALGDERAVITYGEDAAADALRREDTLGDSDLYARAKQSADGMEPSLILAAAPLVALIAESAGGDEDFAKAKPYLDTLDLIAGGTAKDGDRIRQRIALRLR